VKKKLTLAAALLAFAAFMAASYFGYGSLSRGASAGVSRAKTKAPDFTVTDSSGKQVKLSDLRGKPTVVNFWATWCPPCRGEMPHFDEAYREIGGEVNFMMVDLVGGGETPGKAKKFVADQGFTFPVYFDETGEAARRYEVSAIPTSLFVDAEGNLAATSVGAINKQSLMDGIKIARE
jgi:peroxiredoxin